MSSNKLDFAGTGAGANHQESSNCEQQEEEMAGCQQNSCATCLKVLESNSKCDVCSRDISSILASRFPFKMVNEEKEYECPICLMIIRYATELDCSHLMCRECLEHYEKSQIEKYKE